METAEGEIVAGCNVENVSLGLGICAERVAIFAALARGLTPRGRLVVVTRTEDGFKRRHSPPVRFVPMTGKAEEQD